MQWFYWINPEFSVPRAVSFSYDVTRIRNEKRNQTDKIHVLAWEKRGNIKILKGRRPFESYMISFKKETVLGNCPNWVEWSLHGQDCQIEKRVLLTIRHKKIGNWLKNGHMKTLHVMSTCSAYMGCNNVALPYFTFWYLPETSLRKNINFFWKLETATLSQLSVQVRNIWR